MAARLDATLYALYALYAQKQCRIFRGSRFHKDKPPRHAGNFPDALLDRHNGIQYIVVHPHAKSRKTTWAGGPGLASETWVLVAKRNPGLKSETWATRFTGHKAGAGSVPGSPNKLVIPTEAKRSGGICSAPIPLTNSVSLRAAEGCGGLRCFPGGLPGVESPEDLLPVKAHCRSLRYASLRSG
jgi:hypothetical protein